MNKIKKVIGAKSPNAQANSNDLQKGPNSINFKELPPPNPIKIPQHIICKELALKGYRARQVSEITGISYNNVAWYFSKYKLNELALKALEEASK